MQTNQAPHHPHQQDHYPHDLDPPYEPEPEVPLGAILALVVCGVIGGVTLLCAVCWVVERVGRWL